MEVELDILNISADTCESTTFAVANAKNLTKQERRCKDTKTTKLLAHNDGKKQQKLW